MKFTAELVAYSSVVGRSVMFKNEAGACAALVMINVPNPQFDYSETAEPIAHLIAAAPDMRAAILTTIRGLEGEFGQARARVNFPDIYDAIAKASS